MAAPDVCDGTSAVGEADTAFQGSSVGQPSEPCLGKCAACGPPYIRERTQAARAALVTAARQPISAARAVPRRRSSPAFRQHRRCQGPSAPPPAAPSPAFEPRQRHCFVGAGMVRISVISAFLTVAERPVALTVFCAILTAYFSSARSSTMTLLPRS